MNSAAGRPWEGIDLWRSHKQFRETLSEAEEAEFDEYLDEARPAELEERRAELEEEFPDIDLDSPIPEELFHTLPGEDLDRLIDWQYDKALLDDDREREASAEEFAATMAAIADADPAADREERPEFGPRPPLSPQERFEIGFRTKGEITPEMRAWEIAADRALSDQFGQQVVGQWVFGMSDPMLLSEGEELPEGAEVIGPAGEGYPGGRMIRIPTARRKYRIAKDGEFLGQFAYDDRQAASLLYVTFYQNAGTYNLPTSYGVLVDVSTDRIFNTSTSRAPKDVMDAVRADNNGGLWLVDDLSRPDPRWIAAEPKNVDEAMSAMAERIAPKGLVAEWVNDSDHDLNPVARRYRRGLFPPVKDTQPDLSPQATPDDSADGASGSATDNEGSTVDELFGPTPQHLQDLDNIPEGTKPEVDWGDGESLFDEDHQDASADPDEDEDQEDSSIDELFGPTPQHLQDLDNLPDHAPPEVDWGGAEPQWADTGDGDSALPTPVGPDVGPPQSKSKTLIIGGIAVGIAGAALIATFMGGSDGPIDGAPPATDAATNSPPTEQAAAPTDGLPAAESGADDATEEQPSPPTEARTPDGQVPALPSGWAAPPKFKEFGNDVADPKVRYSSGGSLWAWSVWAESTLIAEETGEEGDFVIRKLARIPVGTAIEAELIIDVDCTAGACGYSTVYNDVMVALTLNGLTLTGEYELPQDESQLEVCVAKGEYELEITDLTVINNRLVPDFIRGTRTLNQECGEYELREVIEINGRYLFRGSYADQ